VPGAWMRGRVVYPQSGQVGAGAGLGLR